jgi:type III secretion control protein HpaP
MHSSATHRPRIIAGSSEHAKEAPAASSPLLRRQAALFSRLRNHADARQQDAAEPAGPEPAEAGTQPEIVEARDQRHEEGNEGDDGSGDSREQDSQASEGGDDGAPVNSASTDLPMALHVGAAHHACAQKRRSTPVTAAPSPDKAEQAPRRFIESIVAQVADFCSNPAVLARGYWHITIPIDAALLPGCSLSLTLSYFDLTLRFDTTVEASRHLILQHVATLRESLQVLMKSRSDDSRNIEIIVM